MAEPRSQDAPNVLGPARRPSTLPTGDDGVAETSDGARRRVRHAYLFGLPFWATIALRTVADITPVAGRVGRAEWLAIGAVLASALLLATERALTRRARPPRSR